jgi:predicted metal-dependent phosphotriesterase family hydrolase
MGRCRTRRRRRSCWRVPGAAEAAHGALPADAAAPVRAGLIKAATGATGAGPQERRVLAAAIAAHHATGAPIGTHTERTVWALEQAQAFVDGGVPPKRC